ncbi:PIKK family atypical protein kinase [Histomonas meleagridis]|uniref:PIKK family atypical protein kinase n=1 Tax=Histomonas meleagridis TaxID=135588 RepID=UPI00355A45CC|nr:PIKK family atypical protein kinase [Histomonas meleagridis]KAH0799549.1 PIKK family atypical protein kinase [Histomonas meleagridis]
MSKQLPKDVIVKGSDGNYYQYLLKGHEDMRLDERIMQFFRLINSLLMKETFFNQRFIQIISVIPLSIGHGLVQWVPGTETLRKVVEKIRTVHDVDQMKEFDLLMQYSNEIFDNLLPIQKLQVFERICNEVPDTDIADFFWLKSETSESWVKKTLTFSISCAVNSVVGYIIGLGDRHPSNLLIDSNTGRVVHIDFGDCFEKAANRDFLPEVVPFRLTRQMVRAMGPAGVDGVFNNAFVSMSNILRENCDVLVTVLAIFVQEPLVNPDRPQKTKRLYSSEKLGSVAVKAERQRKTNSSVQMRKRVHQKLTGMDFGNDVPMSVEEQTNRLIENATSPMNLCRMYSGWCPFW